MSLLLARAGWQGQQQARGCAAQPHAAAAAAGALISRRSSGPVSPAKPPVFGKGRVKAAVMLTLFTSTRQSPCTEPCNGLQTAKTI